MLGDRRTAYGDARKAGWDQADTIERYTALYSTLF